MSPIVLLMYGLAVWVISFMLVHEEGPFDMFGKLRDLAGISYDEYSEPIANNLFAKILTCINCTSVWVSLILFLLYLVEREIFILVLVPFAGSAVARIINQRL